MPPIVTGHYCTCRISGTIAGCLYKRSRLLSLFFIMQTPVNWKQVFAECGLHSVMCCVCGATGIWL